MLLGCYWFCFSVQSPTTQCKDTLTKSPMNMRVFVRCATWCNLLQVGQLAFADPCCDRKLPQKANKNALIHKCRVLWCYWGAIRFWDCGVQGSHYGVELGWSKVGIPECHCEPPVPE